MLIKENLKILKNQFLETNVQSSKNHWFIKIYVSDHKYLLENVQFLLISSNNKDSHFYLLFQNLGHEQPSSENLGTIF